MADPTEMFLYTTNSDGWIKKYYLSNGSVENWVNVGGRPLAIALGNEGEVLVCEPVQGQLIGVRIRIRRRNSRPVIDTVNFAVWIVFRSCHILVDCMICFWNFECAGRQIRHKGDSSD